MSGVADSLPAMVCTRRMSMPRVLLGHQCRRPRAPPLNLAHASLFAAVLILLLCIPTLHLNHNSGRLLPNLALVRQLNGSSWLVRVYCLCDARWRHVQTLVLTTKHNDSPDADDNARNDGDHNCGDGWAANVSNHALQRYCVCTYVGLQCITARLQQCRVR